MNVTLRLFQMKKLHWTDYEFDRTYFFFGYNITFRTYVRSAAPCVAAEDDVCLQAPLPLH